MNKQITIIENYILNSLDDIILPTDKSPNIPNLEVFIVNVEEHKAEYECFKKYYEYLVVEFSKFYTPFLHHPLIVQRFIVYHDADKISTSNNYQVDVTQNQNTTLKVIKSCQHQCDYVKILVSLCSKVFDLLDCKEKKLTPKIIQKQIDTVLRIIQSASINVIEQSNARNNDDILNVSYDLYVVINTKNGKNYLKYNVRQLVFTIMTHLNYYGLEHCSL